LKLSSHYLFCPTGELIFNLSAVWYNNNRNDLYGGQDMKKIILGMLLVFLPVISHGAGYVIADYATGGRIDAQSLGLEMGAIFLSPYHPNGGAFSLGLGISVADTDENPPSYSDHLRKFNDGNEEEVYASFGAEIVPAFFGVAGVGYASQDVVKFDTEGRHSETDNNISWMLGMRYILEGIDIGLGVHSRRGVMASLGVAF
jgi:hypothetical protein